MRNRCPPMRQLDLLVKAAEQPLPRLTLETLGQLGQLLQRLLLEVIDAERAVREDADE
ncbi:MAG: hypothetical protein ACRD6B_02750 [Bryobacteraceae bacterium]